jgi:hypothetical protein
MARLIIVYTADMYNKSTVYVTNYSMHFNVPFLTFGHIFCP